MRIMCVTVVLVIFISERQKELASQAGSQPKQDNTTRSLRKRHSLYYQSSTGIVQNMLKTPHNENSLVQQGVATGLHQTQAADKQLSTSLSRNNSSNSRHKKQFRLRRKSGKHQHSSNTVRFTESINGSTETDDHNGGIPTVHPDVLTKSTRRGTSGFRLGQTGRTMRRLKRPRKKRRKHKQNPISSKFFIFRASQPRSSKDEKNKQFQKRTLKKRHARPRHYNSTVSEVARTLNDSEAGWFESLVNGETNLMKVSLLILFTFPPGFLLGYGVIAVVFCIRKKRWLCLTDGCEATFSRLLPLDFLNRTLREPVRQQDLKRVEVITRQVSIPKRRQLNVANPADRIILEEQFDKDRREFLLTGKDPASSLEYDDLKIPVDDSRLSRKEWLAKRLQRWLAMDRHRSLSGRFADPNMPPDESPPSSALELTPMKAKGSAEFSSVSQPRQDADQRVHRSSSEVDSKRITLQEASNEESPESTVVSSEESASSRTTSEFGKDDEKPGKGKNKIEKPSQETLA